LNAGALTNLFRSLIGRSLKGQLLWAVFGLMVFIMVASGWITFLQFRNHLNDQQDGALEGKSALLRAATIQTESGKIGFLLNNDDWDEMNRAYGEELYQIRFADGRNIFRSRVLTELDYDLPQRSGRKGEAVFEVVQLPDGQPGRLLGVAFEAQLANPADAGKVDTAEVHLSIAKSRAPIVMALKSLRDFLIRGGIISTGFLLIVAYILVRRNLRPLDELAEQISTFPIGDSSHRFDLENAPEELDPILDRLNDLMFRFEKVVANERAFTTNAAHELRNPLAGMRSQLEVSLSKERDTEDYRRTLRQLLEIETRLQSSVENLLLLSRLQSTEPGAAAREFQLVEFDFATLLRRSWKPHFDRAEDKQLRVRWNIAPAIPVIRTSERLVELVVRNLFDNAVSYTTENGEIRVHANWTDRRLVFAVENTNPGLYQQDLDQMLVRFWRADAARHGEHLHAGIGLGLCSRIVEVLGGEILPSFTDDGLLRMQVTMPPEGTPPPDAGHPTARLYVEEPLKA
jgi:signal transduction histidine kinase